MTLFFTFSRLLVSLIPTWLWVIGTTSAYVWDTNERLEESDRAGWVLRCQVELILNCLLNFAILIIGLNNDALLLSYNQLNVHPFVKWQEYRV